MHDFYKSQFHELPELKKASLDGEGFFVFLRVQIPMKIRIATSKPILIREIHRVRRSRRFSVGLDLPENPGEINKREPLAVHLLSRSNYIWIVKYVVVRQ